MPPDMTAGLMALAGAPPGAAASAAPLPEPLGTLLFAAFLAQSSPPSIIPAAPKTAATQALTADPKQTPLKNQALPKKQVLPDSKTMDTLPTLSFPASPKSNADASELPLSQVLRHQRSAEDPRPAEGTSAPNAPDPAPSLVGQTAAPPVLFATPPVLFAARVPMTPAAATVPATAATVPVTTATVPVTTATVPAATALIAAVPVPSAFAAPLSQAAPERAMPALTSRSDTPSLISPRAAAPGQTTSALPALAQAVPTQIGLPLPRTWTLTAPPQASPLQTLPVQTLPLQTLPVQVSPVQTGLPTLATAQVTDAGQMPELKAASTDAVKPAAVRAPQAANSLPRVPSPVSAASFQAVPLPQSAPQEAIPDLLPPLAQAPQNIPIPSPAMTVAAAPLAAVLPTRETLVSPTKIAGKFLPAALKPAGGNADTSTRTTLVQDQTESVKAGVPATAPEPTLGLMPEKHAEELKPSLAADSGTNNAPMLQATAPADTAKADKPLLATERAEVVRQVADQVGAMPLPAKPGASEQMSVQLHPKDWGSLQVSVTVSPSQNAGAAKIVTAHIVAETPQVKAALQSQTGALHQALRASGLHLEHLTVSVKAPESKAVEAKAIEVKIAAQSVSAELSSRQGQSGQSQSGQSQADHNQADQSEQARSFGQPGASTGSFGMGSSQNNRQGQPPPVLNPEPEAEDDLIPAMPLRRASGRIDTRA